MLLNFNRAQIMFCQQLKATLALTITGYTDEPNIQLQAIFAKRMNFYKRYWD